MPGDLGYSLANAGQWVCDFAGSADQCGSGSAVFGVVPGGPRGHGPARSPRSSSRWSLVARRPDRLTLLVGLAVLTLAFFVVPTRVHERYGFPFFALAVILAVLSWRWAIAYAVLSVATFLNMYVVLTTLYPNNPSIQDWLGIGPSIRSRAGRDPRSPSCTSAGFALGVPAAARRRAEAARGRAGSGVADGRRARPSARRTVGGRAVARRGPAGRPSPARRSLADRPGARVAGAGARPRAARPWRRFAGAGAIAGTCLASPVVLSAAMPDGAALRGALQVADLDAASDIRRARDHRLVPGQARRGSSPPGPQRDARRPNVAAGSTGSTCGCSSSSSSPRWRFGRSVSPSPTRCTSTRSTTPGRRPSSSRTGATGCPTTSTNGPTRTSRSTRWRPGIVLWGQDDVSATSELGVPARRPSSNRAARTPRRPASTPVNALHVATGTEIRTLRPRHAPARLGRSRPPAPPPSRSTTSTNQLVIGYDDGRIATLDLATMGVGGRRGRPRPRRGRAGRPSRSTTSSSPTTARPRSPPRPTA